MPTGIAPHKEIESDPGAEVRLEMVKRAAAGNESLTVSDLETARGEPSYMYRTLELLKDQRPDAELTLVLGADAAAGLESWRSPERIVELARPAVADRVGVDRAAVESVVSRLGVNGARSQVAFVEMPQIGISSSLVRERVGLGRPIRYLVADTVAELIEERGLYAA